MIKLVRIDDRLLHGQVAFAWSRHLDINTIVIANDKSAGDPMKKMALNLAKPTGTKLYLKSLNDAIEILAKLEDPKFKALVIVETSKDALELVRGSSHIKSINLGGMRQTNGKKLVSRAIAVDEDDISNLAEIDEKGVEVEVRQVPTDSKKIFKTLL